MRSEELLEILLPAARTADTIEAELGGKAFLTLDNSVLGGRLEVAPADGVKAGDTTHMRGSGFNLDPHGVLSSDGFSSGRVFDGFIKQWSKANGWARGSGIPSGREYLSATYLLWRVWEELLKPECHAGVGEVRFTSLYGNPVRYSRVAGEGGIDAPYNVHLKLDEILSIANRIFPVRGAGWLRLFWASGTRVSLNEDGGKFGVYEWDGAVSRECRQRLATTFESVIASLDSDTWEFFVEALNRDSWSWGSDVVSFVDAAHLTAGALGVI